jgi:hypothetical protein
VGTAEFTALKRAPGDQASRVAVDPAGYNMLQEQPKAIVDATDAGVKAGAAA